MVKIETAVQISAEFPAGKSNEYIWMLGQSWPIPVEEESKIVRIEAFGTELDTIGSKFSGGASIKGGATNREICRTWYLQEARYVSEQMRIFYP